MAEPKRRLGKGLEALIGPASRKFSDSTTPISDSPKIRPGRTIPVDQLHPNPYQPRRTMDPAAMEELVKSIREHGIIQPIIVRETVGRYEIIAGERRWRAAKEAGLLEAPVSIRDATDSQMLEVALIENIQREDLNPVERATAYDRYRRQFQLAIEAVAQRLGEDRSTVSNYIRLLELPDPVKFLLSEGRLSMGHARAILGLKDEGARIKMADNAVRNDLSVRAVESAIQKMRESPDSASAGELNGDPVITDLERRLTSQLSAKVKIIPGRKKHSGRVVIHYAGLDDFDRILEQIGIAERA
jgi:ParB family chromosome partitioning protein